MARASHNRRSRAGIARPGIKAGDIRWLPPKQGIDSTLLTDDVVGDGCFNHPVMILHADPVAGVAIILIVTSLKNQTLEERFPHPRNERRQNYLPIHPHAPHPDSGKVLFLAGTAVLDKRSYVNVQNQYKVNLRILNPLNRPCSLESRSLRILTDHVGFVPLAGTATHGSSSLPTPPYSPPHQNTRTTQMIQETIDYPYFVQAIPGAYPEQESRNQTLRFSDPSYMLAASQERLSPPTYFRRPALTRGNRGLLSYNTLANDRDTLLPTSWQPRPISSEVPPGEPDRGSLRDWILSLIMLSIFGVSLYIIIISGQYLERWIIFRVVPAVHSGIEWLRGWFR